MQTRTLTLTRTRTLTQTRTPTPTRTYPNQVRRALLCGLLLRSGLLLMHLVGRRRGKPYPYH